MRQLFFFASATAAAATAFPCSFVLGARWSAGGPAAGAGEGAGCWAKAVPASASIEPRQSAAKTSSRMSCLQLDFRDVMMLSKIGRLHTPKSRVQATFRRALDEHRRVAVARARSAVAEARSQEANPAN